MFALVLFPSNIVFHAALVVVEEQTPHHNAGTHKASLQCEHERAPLVLYQICTI